MRSCSSPRRHISSVNILSPFLSLLSCKGLTSLLWRFRFRLSPAAFWLPQHRPTFPSVFWQFHVKSGDSSPFGFVPPKKKLTHSVMDRAYAYFYPDVTVTFILLFVGLEAGDRAVTNLRVRVRIRVFRDSRIRGRDYRLGLWFRLWI